MGWESVQSVLYIAIAQEPDMADHFDAKDTFEFFQKIFSPMPFPMSAMFPSLKQGDIDKKIQELKTVESWLAMNLGFVQMTIKTLELQQATMTALNPSEIEKMVAQFTQASQAATAEIKPEKTSAKNETDSKEGKELLVPWPWNMLLQELAKKGESAAGTKSDDKAE